MYILYILIIGDNNNMKYKHFISWRLEKKKKKKTYIPAKFGAISWGLVIHPEYSAPISDTATVNNVYGI